MDRNELFTFTKDQIGSIREVMDQKQDVIQRYSYSSYGKTKLEKITKDRNTVIDVPYGFTTREWEKETGDYFYRARYYDPETGRFLSEDAQGFVGLDLNLYRYVKNGPQSYGDPEGSIPIPVITGIVGGTIGMIGGIYNSDACSVLGVIGDGAWNFGVGFAGGFFAGIAGPNPSLATALPLFFIDAGIHALNLFADPRSYIKQRLSVGSGTGGASSPSAGTGGGSCSNKEPQGKSASNNAQVKGPYPHCPGGRRSWW